MIFKSSHQSVLLALALFAVTSLLHPLGHATDVESGYAKWKNSLPADPSFFPLAVWLQDPRNAEKYKAAGINVYVGLWQGPTEEQLAALKKAKMPVICDQNEIGMKHKDDPTIAGWMHGDEPDNAQALPGGKGYGPPIATDKIIDEYKKLKAADATRPVFLDLGQGVAWDGWIGRGVRTNKPEDYAEYVKGADVVSYDIYPVAHDNKDVAGKLWLVPFGVERLCKWTNNEKIVWNCIECTHIGTPDKIATPHQVKAEVWMSLIHGSKGIIYFVHQFKPTFNEHALLDDPEMLTAVTALNKQIQELARVLNSPVVKEGATVASSDTNVPIDALTKRDGGATYVFAVGMRDGAAKGLFQVPGIKAGKVEVIGENRALELANGKFEDEFKAFDVHLYKIKE
jgi:hypothetical protein